VLTAANACVCGRVGGVRVCVCACVRVCVRSTAPAAAQCCNTIAGVPPVLANMPRGSPKQRGAVPTPASRLGWSEAEKEKYNHFEDFTADQLTAARTAQGSYPSRQVMLNVRLWLHVESLQVILAYEIQYSRYFYKTPNLPPFCMADRAPAGLKCASLRPLIQV
jgi:hypothetical protein